MITRGRVGTVVPNRRYLNNAAVETSVLMFVRAALRDPEWHSAMHDEYQSLRQHGTWELVSRPPGANVVTGKWVCHNKYHDDGTLERRKARWVVRGFTQCHGIDFDETFSPVVKPATIRMVLHLATSRDWPVHQLDVKNAFLHSDLHETVYSNQPTGFVDPEHPNHVCLLRKSLYGLKQAPRAWFSRFATHIHELGFKASLADSSLFILNHGADTAHLLLYVNDIVLSASSSHGSNTSSTFSNTSSR